MKTKMKIFSILTMLSAVIYFTFPAVPAKATGGGTKTTIRMNGLSADTFLVEESTNTNRFLNVGRDRIANTTMLDFSYATPDTVNPEIVYLIHGSGEIPNSALTISSMTAHLAVTTAFPVNYCAVNLVTADFNCEDSTPITFNLTWVKNGYGSLHEKTQRTETFGPVTIKYKAEYDSVTAKVNGIWSGHYASELFGNLVDTKNNTNTREITVAAHH